MVSVRSQKFTSAAVVTLWLWLPIRVRPNVCEAITKTKMEMNRKIYNGDNNRIIRLAIACSQILSLNFSLLWSTCGAAARQQALQKYHHNTISIRRRIGHKRSECLHEAIEARARYFLFRVGPESIDFTLPPETIRWTTQNEMWIDLFGNDAMRKANNHKSPFVTFLLFRCEKSIYFRVRGNGKASASWYCLTRSNQLESNYFAINNRNGKHCNKHWV